MHPIQTLVAKLATAGTAAKVGLVGGLAVVTLGAAGAAVSVPTTLVSGEQTSETASALAVDLPGSERGQAQRSDTATAVLTAKQHRSKKVRPAASPVTDADAAAVLAACEAAAQAHEDDADKNASGADDNDASEAAEHRGDKGDRDRGDDACEIQDDDAQADDKADKDDRADTHRDGEHQGRGNDHADSSAPKATPTKTRAPQDERTRSDRTRTNQRDDSSDDHSEDGLDD